jgi:nucleotide-binding universal stress UspA family protein
MTSLPVADSRSTGPDPGRLLICIHGHEPYGWARDVCRAVASRTGLIRLLVVVEVAAPPFTSLLPAARRRYRAALSERRRHEEEHSRVVLEELLTALPGPPEVVRLAARRADPARTIGEHAREWDADVVVVGRDTRPRLWQALFGAVHERVVQFTPCAVLVTPAVRADAGAGLRLLPAAGQGGRG